MESGRPLNYKKRMEYKSLRALFDSRSNELKETLEGLSLPEDSSKVQGVVQQYLAQLFDGDGDFRMSLTQSEDYILQAAMSLLNAQQAMATELSKEAFVRKPQSNATLSEQSNDSGLNLKKETIPYTIGATAAGGVVGGLILGTWGAVFGSIAGTAIIFYCATTKDKKNVGLKSSTENIQRPMLNRKSLNTDVFISIIGKICDSIDSLINTFRSQLDRVVAKYESQPAPALETNFLSILEGIQSLIGYERTHSEDEGKYINKLKQRIEDLAEILGNYNLEVVNFTSDTADLFDVTVGNDNRMVYPAITKEGTLILKGKAFSKD